MKLYDFLKCELGCTVLAHFGLMHFIKWLEKKISQQVYNF